MDFIMIFLLILTFLVIYWIFIGEKMQKRMFGENEPSLNKVRVLKQIYDLKQKQKSNNQADDKNSENIKNIENRKATGYDESNESDKYNKNNESERPYKLNELNQREGFQKKRQ